MAFQSIHTQDWDNGWSIAPTNSTRVTRYSNGLIKRAAWGDKIPMYAVYVIF